jgi:hypothetical protein
VIPNNQNELPGPFIKQKESLKGAGKMVQSIERFDNSLVGRLLISITIWIALINPPAQAQWISGSVEYYPGGAYPCTVITADFNGDAILDLAVANSGADPASGVKANGSVSILLGQSNGTFTPKVDYSAGLNSTSLVTADFNGDGKLDLAVTNFGSNSISIFPGRGDGTFESKRDIAVGQTPAIICAGDFNGDGLTDMVFTNYQGNAFTLVLGKGDGTFFPGTELPGGIKPVGMAVADFNGDGILDVATSCQGDETQGLKPEINLLYGKEDGSFDTQNRKRIEIGPEPFWLIAADLNNDGQMDLSVSTGNGVSVLLNQQQGTFLPIKNYPLGSSQSPALGLTVGDWDGDGNLDLAATSAAPPSVFFLPGNGRGGFAVVGNAISLSGKPAGMSAGDFNGDGRLDLVATNAALDQVVVFRNGFSILNSIVPIVLSLAGANNSFYTSEMTLANRGTIPSYVHFTYTPAIGSGGGGATIFLDAGRQLIVPDTISFLKEHYIPIPDSNNSGGTLAVSFSRLSSPAAGIVKVRTTTTTRDPVGRAGLAYSDVHTNTSALLETSYICGLRQDEKDRSNVAVIHAGGPGDGKIDLLLSLYSGDPSTPSHSIQYLTSLEPGGFKQFNQILISNGASIHQGYVKVERISGTAPYFAYGVINDQANSDGSFILPSPITAQSAIHRLTIPVMVETDKFSSELVLSNLATIERSVQLDYVSDEVATVNHTASIQILLKPSEQIIIPSFIQYLREHGVEGVGMAGSTFAGALFVTVKPDAIGDATLLYVNGRTSTPGGGGRYGLFYPAVPEGRAAQKVAWLYGLQQNTENRTNLTLVNTGEKDNSLDVFKIELYDGVTGQIVQTIENVEVKPRKWLQLNSILSQAPGTTQGYARISLINGGNPFIAYAVINDGAAPGLRSGDGAFIAME